MAKDPNAVAANWANRLAGSTQQIQDGVQSVAVAPGLAAARQKDIWATNTANSKDKWASNTSAVTLPEWQAAMIQKGLPRIAGGAQAAQPKFATFMSELLPQIDRVVAGLPARGGLEANINRSAQFARGMAAWRH